VAGKSGNSGGAAQPISMTGSNMLLENTHHFLELEDATVGELSLLSVKKSGGRNAATCFTDFATPKANRWFKGVDPPKLEVQMTGSCVVRNDAQTEKTMKFLQSSRDMQSKVQPKNIPLAGQIDATPDQCPEGNEGADYQSIHFNQPFFL
jgi:hypothetical protein